LEATEGKLPLLYIVRKEWGDTVSSWVAENTPSAIVSAILDSHLGFWESPKHFNAELMGFLANIW